MSPKEIWRLIEKEGLKEIRYYILFFCIFLKISFQFTLIWLVVIAAVVE